MTTYTIPAACLEALGSLKAEDPPVLYSHFADAHSARNAWHPSMGGEPFLSGAVLRLPASSAAVAAVLARAVGLDPSLGVGLRWETHRGVRVLWLDTRRGSFAFAADRIMARENCIHVPTLSEATNAHHALALAAVWVARVKRYEAHATAMATLETVERYEKANGWDVWEVT